MEFDLYGYVYLPLMIFVARIADVSMGTFRIILFSKNRKLLVSAIAFVEILIWLLAVRQIFVNLTNPICYIAFAGGFSAGNFVGLVLEERVALGFCVIRIITSKKSDELSGVLTGQGFRLTRVPAKGATGDVDILFTIIPRSQLKKVKQIIKDCNPNAFYTVEDVKAINEAPVVGRRKKLSYGMFKK